MKKILLSLAAAVMVVLSFPGPCCSAAATPSSTPAATAAPDSATAEATPVSAAVLFSKPAGLYDEGFLLELSSPDGGRIFYTTDGSIPDPDTNPATVQYSGPIRIEKEFSAPVLAKRVIAPWQFNPEYRIPSSVRKASVIRALAIDKDGLPSAVETASYFIGLFEGISQRIGVVSVAGSAEELFSKETGVYNDTDPDESKAIVNVEYFDKNGDKIFTYDAETRIFGGFTRNFAQRSFILDFSKGTTKDRIRYPLFGGDSRDIHGEKVKSFDRLRLHSGGNDSKLTTFLEGVVMDLSRNMAIGTNPYIPVIAFINGEYWGLYALREDFKADYFDKHYDIPEENVIAAKIVWGCDNVPTMTMGEQTDIRYYEEMVAFLENHDFEDDVSYSHFISYYIDVDSMIDFYIANLYVNNIDWPGNNVRMWRSRTVSPEQSPLADGKWRFILHDVDAGLKDQSKEMFTVVLKKGAYSLMKPGPPYDDWATLLFRKMVQNPRFVEKFKDRMLVHLNSTYEKQKVLAAIGAASAIKADFITEHKDRWGQTAVYPYSLMVSQLKSFVFTRTEKVLGLMNQYFTTGVPRKVEFSGLRGIGRFTVRFGQESMDISGSEESLEFYAYQGSVIRIEDSSSEVKGYFVKKSGQYRFVRGAGIDLEIGEEKLKVIPVRFDLRDSLLSPEGILILVLAFLLAVLLVRAWAVKKAGKESRW